MRTVGVDLAGDPANTAMAVIDWHAGGARAEIHEHVGDAAILAHRSADALGIDAPLGWPRPFVALVNGALVEPAEQVKARAPLRYRATDLYLQEIHRARPLSVSSDLIAVPAMRCQHLLHALGVTDRSGDGRVFEVYPALALRLWGLPRVPYKGKARVEACGQLWAALRARMPWLTFASESHERTVRTVDHALDAVVAAVIARLAKIGAVEEIPAEHREAARVEGWIVVPAPGSLERAVRG